MIKRIKRETGTSYRSHKARIKRRLDAHFRALKEITATGRPIDAIPSQSWIIAQDYAKIKNTYLRPLIILPPQKINFGVLSEIADKMPDTYLSIISSTLSQRESEERMKKIVGLMNVDSDLIEGTSASEERRHQSHLNTLHDLDEKISAGEELIHDVSIILTVKAKSGDELEEKTSQLTEMLKARRLNWEIPVGRIKDAVIGTMPLCRNAFGTYLATTALAYTYPMALPSKENEQKIPVGAYATTGLPFSMDNFELNDALHVIVMGKIGSGKSFFVKVYTVRAHDIKGYQIVYVDRRQIEGKSEYAPIVEELGGRVLQITDRVPEKGELEDLISPENRAVCIDLSNASEKLQEESMESLFGVMSRQLKTRTDRRILVVDEIVRILKSESKNLKSNFEDIARLGRTSNQAIISISQKPEDYETEVGETLVQNSGTKVFAGLDRSVVRKAAEKYDLNSRLEEVLKKLPKKNSLFLVGEHGFEAEVIPTPLELRLFETNTKGVKK